MRVKLVKHVHDGVDFEVAGVLFGDVDRDLQVLTHVQGEKFLETLERPIATERTEELDERLRFDRVRVDDLTLQVGELRSVPWLGCTNQPFRTTGRCAVCRSERTFLGP